MTPKKPSLEQLTHFAFEVRQDGVAVATMDCPGEAMNTLSDRISEEMDTILSKMEEDPACKALVFTSGKKDSFIVGADIKMLDRLESAEQAAQGCRDIHTAMFRLEDLWTKHRKPVVAAIHGPCLGGGLEVALACSARIISDDLRTKLGLPEVKLGLIPGAGGTQRLPALIGVTEALGIILRGGSAWPRKAKKLGLADEVVPASIVTDVAIQRAGEMAAGSWSPVRSASGLSQESLQRLALEENPIGRSFVFKKALEDLRKQTRGNYPAPEKALECVRAGVEDGQEAGYEAEALAFGELVSGSESSAMIGLFFATQALKKDGGGVDAKPRPVTKVGVLGGGLMGGGIAAVSAIQAGKWVRINEVDDAGIARGLAYPARLLKRSLKRKQRSTFDTQRILHRITGTTDYRGFGDVDVVIEAVFEDLKLKQTVLQAVEAKCGPETIFASNTSSLPITDIATASAHPETVIGMHYFSPVDKMPLLEIIVTDTTADWVTATCVQLGKDQGKTVIVVKDGVGFYTSRVLGPFMNEAAWMLDEGVAIEQLDAVMKDFGFPVGPIVLLDEVGIDVGAKVGKIVHGAFGDRMKPPGTMDALMADGRTGRKGRKGFYLYDKDGKKGGVDTSVYEVLGQTSSRKTLDPDEIQQRMALAFVNEAALCLQEGIVRSPRDADIGAIFGLGFPPFRGGPFNYVDSVGAETVVARMDAFGERFGARFDAAQILRDHAKSGKKFRG